jgi:SAM-dependent methyltransferase
MIDVAKEKAAKAGSAIDFQVALIEALPFPAATFDLVTSSLMLHHLPDDLKRTGLAEIRRVLKPGGRFVAMDFAAHSHSPHGPGRPLGHLLAIFGHARREHGRQADADAKGRRLQRRGGHAHAPQERRLHPCPLTNAEEARASSSTLSPQQSEVV